MKILWVPIILLAVAASRAAADTVTFTTDITGAQTQLDNNNTPLNPTDDHITTFNFSVLSGMTVTQINGFFTIKRGPSTSTNVYMYLWNGFNRGSYPVPLASDFLTPAEVTQSFAQAAFAITGLNIGAGQYSVSVEAPDAPDVQSEAYFIKSEGFTADPPGIVDTNPPGGGGTTNPVPEPATLLLSLLAGAGLLAARRGR